MNIESPKRGYRQSARAEAAQATAARILDAFEGHLRNLWFDEIRLDDVAREAGVTVQTVIRRFGGKDGLLDATQRRLGDQIMQRRAVAEGDVLGAVAGLIEDYETVGDLVMRSLAQEDRYPAIRAVNDFGRKMHREWIATAFAPWLRPLEGGARLQAEDALVVAGDVYVWKLVRRDMQRPVADYRDLLERLLATAVGVSRDQLFHPCLSGERP